MKTLRLLILFALVYHPLIHAQILGPGSFQTERHVRPPKEAAFSITPPRQFEAVAQIKPLIESGSIPVAEVITPEIQALADGLQDNPERIFDYVHDHIKFVLYFGSKKGAALTLLEKSGNDFDQCALLVALLSAAGYSNNLTYQFGWMEIPYDDPTGKNYDFHHWWQLTLNNTNLATTGNYLANLVGSRGYPTDSDGYPLFYYYTAPSEAIDGYTNNFVMQRVWVDLALGSTNYMLDPAFKISLPIAPLSGFSLTNAMGSGNVSNDLLSAASGTDSANYTQNLSEPAVRSKLTAYVTNLLNFIHSNAPNASMQDVLGGRQIVPANNSIDFTIATRYPSGSYGQLPLSTWTYEPTELMSTLDVTFAGQNYQWFMPQLQGQRLSLTFSASGTAQLWQEDNLLAQGTTSGSGTTSVVLAITHPVGTWNPTNNSLIYDSNNKYSQTVTNTYQSTNATYALMYCFEPVDWGWLQQRQTKLDQYIQEGFTNGSRQVTSETLNIMGLQWLLQTTQMGQLMAAQEAILPQMFHRIGRMGQEAGRGYYVDVYAQVVGSYASGGYDLPNIQLRANWFELWMAFGSAFEYGIIEQMQSTNLVGASTVKIEELANTNGQAVYLASSGNWSAIQGNFINYGGILNQIYNNYISQGYYVLLPANGSNQVATTGSWSGYAYEALYSQNGSFNVQNIISGGYYGGYDSDGNAVVDTGAVQTDGDSQPDSDTASPPTTQNPSIADPIDTADGTFQVENTDLSIGQAEPRGITLSRYYNGTRRFNNSAGIAGGWIHNYIVNANNVPAPQAGLGGTTPAQAVSMLVATAAAIATFNGGYPDAKNWLTTDLITKWGVDQLTKNGVSVNLGKDTLQFVAQPSGIFTPPANCTSSLTQSNSQFSLLMRHGNAFNFDSRGRLAAIIDQYGNSLSVDYLNSTSTLPQTVTDWKNRHLSFTYTGSQLTTVSDGTRFVSYDYSTNFSSQGDLTSFKDAQRETSTYTYDTNHQITATIDALGQLVVSNIYDNQAHVKTQFTEGLTNKTWQIFWSGWQTTEIDPAGDVQNFFFDDFTRLIAQVSSLGHTNQMFYDGQNHAVTTASPLNETNRFVFDSNNNLVQAIDALGFTNRFVFDVDNNLVETIDPLGHSNTFRYNAEFSLVGQTNGAGDWVNYQYYSDGTLAFRADSGGTTDFGYDSYGQLNLITYPGNPGSESFINDAMGDVITNIDGRGFATTYTYNARREVTASAAPTNLTTTVTFDAADNVSATKDARGNTTSNSWSATRHRLATTFPRTTQGVPVATNIYDNRDWLVSTVDPLSNTTFYTNDPDERLISRTDPLGRTMRQLFDADSRVLSTVNAANETNNQTYEKRGLMISQTDGAGYSILCSNDPAGNQVILTNRNGNKWQFHFDGANRLTFTISPLGRSNSVVFNHQGLPAQTTDAIGNAAYFYYDAKRRLTNRTDNLAPTTYSYDANDNRTSVSEAGRSNFTTYDAYNRISSYQDVNGYLIYYRWDANGNLTNLIYPGNRSVFYRYDALNQLTNVTDWAGRQTSIGYALDGHVTSIIRPNGTFRTVSYDVGGQVTNIWEQMANSLPIAWFRLNWTNSGNMAWEFAAPLPHTNTPPTRTMTYDIDDRLSTINGVGVTSDLNGNLTHGPTTNSTFVQYGYDVRNRLLNVGGVTNSYDAINNRIGQTFGTNTTTFVLNPVAAIPQMLMRVKNGVTTYYVYGPGLLYQITETATATNTLTYSYDYRGSTVALSGDNGLVTDRVEYSTYGSTTYRSGTSDTPFLFDGRFGVQTDPNGLLYMQSRYYNPYLCRFTRPDPSRFSGGLNFYAYANGNPVSYLDPSGLGAVGENQSSSWLNATIESGGQLGNVNLSANSELNFSATSDANNLPADYGVDTSLKGPFLTYPNGDFVSDRNTDLPYPLPSSLDVANNVNKATGAGAFDMVWWFHAGGDMDYQRPNGLIAAMSSPDEFIGLYTDVTFYNFGAVAASAGYTLEDTLDSAGAYNVYFGNAKNANATGLRSNAIQSISQGWSDTKLSHVWQK